MNKEMEYIKNESNRYRLVRTELIFAPLLVVAPFLLGLYFINDWFYRDITLNQLELEIELILGIIVIIANIAFDIPFLKSLKQNLKKSK